MPFQDYSRVNLNPSILPKIKYSMKGIQGSYKNEECAYSFGFTTRKRSVLSELLSIVLKISF